MKTIIERASDYIGVKTPCEGCKRELVHYKEDAFVLDPSNEKREANVWTKTFHGLNDLFAWIHSIGGRLVIEESNTYLEYSYKLTIYDSWIE